MPAPFRSLKLPGYDSVKFTGVFLSMVKTTLYHKLTLKPYTHLPHSKWATAASHEAVLPLTAFEGTT
jgi:hypothetical protein